MSNYNYQKPQNLATVSTVAYECLGDAWQPTFGFLFPENDDLAPVKSLVADEDAEISLKNIHILSDKDDNTLGVTAALLLNDVQPMRQKMLFKLIGMVQDKAAFMQKMSGYALSEQIFSCQNASRTRAFAYFNDAFSRRV